MNEEILIYCCTLFVEKLIKEFKRKTISATFFIQHTNIKINFLLHHIDKIQDPLLQKRTKALMEDYNKVISSIINSKSK